MPMIDEASGSTSHNLLRQVRAQDPEAWRRFVAIYAPLVYHWARRGGLQASDAQDIVQDVFRTVCCKIDDFQRDGQASRFRGWLWVITRNRVRLFFRKLGTQPHGGSSAVDALAQIPDLWQREDEPSTGAEVQHLVRRALASIKPHFSETSWQAFWRMAIDGQSAADVAEELRLTPTAVRQAKYRVLCRLREELADF